MPCMVTTLADCADAIGCADGLGCADDAAFVGFMTTVTGACEGAASDAGTRRVVT